MDLLKAAATILAEVYRLARGSTKRTIGVQSVLDATGIDAVAAEAAIDLLVRQNLVIATNTPAHSVRLTTAGWQMARAEPG